MLHIFFTLLTCQSAKVVEYRFGYNYGEIFRDFSNNGRHAVNGVSHSTTNEDTLATDRGAYFSGSEQTITLPPNTYVTSNIALTTPWTILVWTLALDFDGYVFTRSKVSSSSDDYFYIRRKGDNNNIRYRISVSGNDSGSINAPNESFLSGKI